MITLRSVLVVCVLSLMLMASANAQWVQTNGPYGASISSFAVVPNGAGGTNLFAGCVPDPNSGPSGGVFLSTNSGEKGGCESGGVQHTRSTSSHTR